MKLLPVLLLITIAVVGCGPQNKDADPAAAWMAKAEVKGPENGTLLIVGGAAKKPIYDKFMELVGGPDAPVIVVPTSFSSDTLDAEFLAAFKRNFMERGFNNVTVLHTRDREVANSEQFIEPVKKAVGVWFWGGRQWRHADSYLNTKTHEAFKELLRRGGVIAGSSAGATIQGSYLARGDTKENTIMMGDHEEGMGFITNVAIDQHLLARNRQFDMFEILEKKPELLGIGLDENTGIIVKGDEFEVVGESYVVIYDGTRWSAEKDTVFQLPPGSKEFYMLKAGNRYNLKDRKVIVSEKAEVD
ncbi:MAG TPA: peptidase S51 [Cytophagales bacterium]|nr:peptidase S51 [Cytophagales bacterium]HCR54461.1 peptidase S51 [Cytophagales bacterium]